MILHVCGEDVVQLVERVPCLQEALNWISSSVVRFYKLGTLEGEAGRTEVHGHPWLQEEFKTSLGYSRPCLKEKGRTDEGKAET